MKRVFVVVGNHDGNLGVYTNVKRAYERAQKYFIDAEEEIPMSYSQVYKETKGWWGCVIGNG